MVHERDQVIAMSDQEVDAAVREKWFAIKPVVKALYSFPFKSFKPTSNWNCLMPIVEEFHLPLNWDNEIALCCVTQPLEEGKAFPLRIIESDSRDMQRALCEVFLMIDLNGYIDNAK